MNPQRPGKKVLVVDDDQALCTLVERYLSKHGFHVLTAPDAPTALATLEFEKDVGVVITDLMMPLMNGIKFAETLKSDERYRDIPVILMTAYPEEQLLEKGLRKGVALTLSKPIHFDQLLTLVGFAA